MEKITHRLFGSVFAKLLAVILLTGIGIHLAVGVFFWQFRNEASREFSQTLAHYLSLLLSEIGTPPDFEKAAALAAAGAFQLRYSGPDRSWSTREGMPSGLPERSRRLWQPQPGMRAAFSRGRVLVEVEQPPGRLLFEIGPAPARFEIVKPVLLLLFLVSLLLALAYLSFRRILRPLAWLKEGVLEVGRGNLDHRVPQEPAGRHRDAAACARAARGFRAKHLYPSDEFRDLARAFNDMTERIREMLEARERLMLDVSHELRSPLTRLKVALEFLPDDAVKESLREDVAVMEAMTTAILENARIRHQQGQIEREPLELAPLLKEAAAEFENRGPGVEVGVLTEAVAARINPELIRTVLRNLMANAVNHSPPGSLPIEVHLEKRPPFALIRVTDHGTGIAPEDLPRIFDPFFRADPSRSRAGGGYGLGLGLCRTIAEAHEGRIEVESAPGRGSSFKLFLPLHA
jgi:signal transduction histidine kinase